MSALAATTEPDGAPMAAIPPLSLAERLIRQNELLSGLIVELEKRARPQWTVTIVPAIAIVLTVFGQVAYLSQRFGMLDAQMLSTASRVEKLEAAQRDVRDILVNQASDRQAATQLRQDMMRLEQQLHDHVNRR